MNKDKCTRCESENVNVVRIKDIDDDGNEIITDMWDGHCNDCGWDFILVDL